MKTADIKKAFIECVYDGNRGAYLKARKLTPFASRERSHKSNTTTQHFKEKGAAEKWRLQKPVTAFLN